MAEPGEEQCEPRISPIQPSHRPMIGHSLYAIPAFRPSRRQTSTRSLIAWGSLRRNTVCFTL